MKKGLVLLNNKILFVFILELIHADKKIFKNYL